VPLVFALVSDYMVFWEGEVIVRAFVDDVFVAGIKAVMDVRRIQGLVKDFLPVGPGEVDFYVIPQH
jgi:hypothetical protein